MSFFSKVIEIFGLKKTDHLPYWLKISTESPQCTYYFGPFDSPLEAKALQMGYVEDLVEENARGISVELQQRSQPEELTMSQEDIVIPDWIYENLQQNNLQDRRAS